MVHIITMILLRTGKEIKLNKPTAFLLSFSNIWFVTISGDQSNQWNTAIVTLNTKPNISFTLRFEAVAGPGYQSDIALDDVSLSVGSCPGKSRRSSIMIIFQSTNYMLLGNVEALLHLL